LETNKKNESLLNDEWELVLPIVREVILQSLVRNHCPKTPRLRQVATTVATTSFRRQSSIRSTSLGSDAEGEQHRHLLEVEVLSLYPTTSSTDFVECSLTTTTSTSTAESKSCHIVSNDLMVLLDSLSLSEHSDSTMEQLQSKMLSTIDVYMKQKFYLGLINHRLEEEGSDTVVTALNILESLPDQGNQALLSVSLAETAGVTEIMPDIQQLRPRPFSIIGAVNASVTTEAPSENGQVPDGQVLEPTSLVHAQDNPMKVTLGATLVVLGVLFTWVIVKLMRTSNFSKKSVFKANEDDSIRSDTLDTNVESITHTVEEGNEQTNAVTTLEINSTPAAKTLVMSESTFDADTVVSKSSLGTNRFLSLPPHRATSTLQQRPNYVGVIKSMDPLTGICTHPCNPYSFGSDAPSYNSGRCENSTCRSCRSWSSRKELPDPEYLCPNYKLPGRHTSRTTTTSSNSSSNSNSSKGSNSSNSPSRDVLVRQFSNNGSVWSTDEYDPRDNESRSVIPPSRVNQTRGHTPILIKSTIIHDGSFGFNSILASDGGESFDISNCGTDGKQSDVSSSTTSYYFRMGRRLRPAKSVQL